MTVETDVVLLKHIQGEGHKIRAPREAAETCVDARSEACA